jgi:hypothetical protein
MTMALSDQLTKLAARTKEVEDRAAAAKAQRKGDLEKEVKNAREAAQTQADSLHAQTDKTKGDLSDLRKNLGREWKKQTALIRRDIDEDRAVHDLAHAQKAAQRADDDAEFAIDYVYAALAEAEYAVLDAYLAHSEADELAEAASSG